VSELPPNQSVALGRASITVFRDITFLAAGAASERTVRRQGSHGATCPPIHPKLCARPKPKTGLNRPKLEHPILGTLE